MEKQQLFLEKLRYILPANISYVDSLSEILQLSPDSVYRRIRGETSLTFDEVVKLCGHFRLSFDSLVECEEAAVTFNYNQIYPEVESFKNYLRNILDDLMMIGKIGTGKITYIAEDIPFFHLFVYPELASFKMYYWMKSVLNVPEYQNQKFKFENTDKEILEIGQKMCDAYSTIPSVEIWTEYTPNSLRKQIEYYYEAGLFDDPAEADIICNQAADLLQMVSNLADKSSKLDNRGKQNYTLYYSEIEIGNNCILVEVNNIKKVYLTFNTFNKMSTTNEKFCNETSTWIDYITAKSNLISGVSEKQRLQFINKILGQLEVTRKLVALG